MEELGKIYPPLFYQAKPYPSNREDIIRTIHKKSRPQHSKTKEQRNTFPLRLLCSMLILSFALFLDTKTNGFLGIKTEMIQQLITKDLEARIISCFINIIQFLLEGTV